MPGPQRARPAGPEHAYSRSGTNFDFSPFLIWKSLIGRFYWEELKAMGVILMKMAVLLKGSALCAWTAMDLAAISSLKSTHWSISKKERDENENSARPRCDFLYTKNSARPRSDFIYTKNFQEGRCDSCLTVSVLRVRFLFGNRWGRSWRKWPLPLRKTRCALLIFKSSFSIWKSIIGIFWNREWAKKS